MNTDDRPEPEADEIPFTDDPGVLLEMLSLADAVPRPGGNRDRTGAEGEQTGTGETLELLLGEPLSRVCRELGEHGAVVASATGPGSPISLRELLFSDSPPIPLLTAEKDRAKHLARTASTVPEGEARFVLYLACVAAGVVHGHRAISTHGDRRLAEAFRYALGLEGLPEELRSLLSAAVDAVRGRSE